MSARGMLVAVFAKRPWRSVPLVSLLLASIPALAQQTGPVVGSDTSTIRNPGLPIDDLTSYGKPNQSRIWYNSARNRWDAVVPRLDTDGSSDHYILTDVPGSQSFTSVELARRDFARPDVFWDDANQKLYVLASHPVESRFWRVGYDDGTDTYSIEVGAPGTGVAIPGITHPNNFLGGSSPATLYVTPNGDVWVGVMANDGLEVQHSVDGGSTWLAAPVVLDGAAGLGVTTWIDFEFGGTTFVGVFAAENGEFNAQTDFFFWYIDQYGDPTIPGNWIDDSANIPGPVGTEQSDDHNRAARDAAGNVYFAVKTEGGNPTDPLIKLFKRTPGGTWSQFKVTETQEVPEQSRPSVVIDDENGELYLYVTGAEIVDPDVREGGRFKASLDSLEDLATAPLVTLFSEPGTIFTDIISPRAAVNSTSGIVVLAHNRTLEEIWYGAEEIQPANVVTVPDVVGLPRADAEAAIIVSGLTVGTVSIAGSQTVPAGHVISQDPLGGSTAATGSTVDLVVSLGPDLVIVPFVVGLSQAAAEAEIVTANLTVGAVSTQSSDTVPAGDVISQGLPGGAVVATGSAVDLVVSLGPPVNTPPTIVSTPVLTATEGDLYSYGVEAVDPDAGDVLTFSLDAAPSGMSIDATTGLVQWTPAATQVGDNTVSVRVADTAGAFDTQSFVVDVAAANRAPSIVSTPGLTATEGSLYTYDVEAVDPDAGDVLTFSLDAAPSGMSIDANTGLVQWTPAATQVGDNAVSVRVADTAGAFDTQSYTISVALALVTVPDVVGLSQAAAESALLAAGLSVGTISAQYSETVPAGNVISQDPLGGASEVPGSPVDLVISLGSSANLIPGTFPLSSATELEIRDNVTMNGNPVRKDKTGSDSVVRIDGTHATVAQSLPALVPASFPANGSSRKATDADSPFVSSTAVFYDTIEIRNGRSAQFSGGGPFHIKELKVKEDATVNLGAGTYFIKTLKMDGKRATLVVTGEPVVVHIGDKVDVRDKDVDINVGGSVAGLRVFLRHDAEFLGDDRMRFTGVIYGPQTKKVEVKKNSTFRGAIITSGQIKIEDDVQMTYTTGDQQAVSSISTVGN